MVDVISLLKLLKDLLPEEAYRNIVRLILDLMENEDRVAYARLRKVIMDWARKYYPEFEKLVKMILDKLRPAGAEEAATYVTFGGVAEAGAVVASGPLAILGGLALPAVKWWGRPHIDLGGWWRDPCEEKYAAICAAYADHMQERGSFPKGFKSGSPATMKLVSNAGHVLTLCGLFLKECPDHTRKKSVEFIEKKMTEYQSEYWNF